MKDEKNEERPLFVLAGNGPYENRGCEAIVRGTTKILRKYFNDPRFVCLSRFNSEEQYKKQYLQESDKDIVHLSSCMFNKKKVIQNLWNPEMWYMIYQYYFNRNSFYYMDMLPSLSKTQAVLSVGGDNYSLDYGVPTLFTALDDLVLSYQKPLVIWGASVGPFSSMPEYERYMRDHLQKVTGIFARESATIEYLKSIGVNENVYSVADPAFLMDSTKPVREIAIEEGAIGLNFSPLMARYVTGGDLEQWAAMTAAIIAETARRTERQVYLIPHATIPGSNDHIFMQNALSMIPEKKEHITLVPPYYNAAETKWIISQMALFAGARTHATIASLSSGVPTLSFAYSSKAQGINQDIFGHTNYCMNPEDLNAETVVEQITSMLDECTAIRKNLKDNIPVVQRSALNAGILLKKLLREN